MRNPVDIVIWIHFSQYFCAVVTVDVSDIERE